MTSRQSSLEDRLSRFPEVRQRVEELLAVMENCGDDVARADAAELRVREVLRQLGNEALHGWAQSQIEAAEAEHRQGDSPGVSQGKKNLSGGGRPSVSSK